MPAVSRYSNWLFNELTACWDSAHGEVVPHCPGRKLDICTVQMGSGWTKELCRYRCPVYIQTCESEELVGILANMNHSRRTSKESENRNKFRDPFDLTW
ncbi:hypothetical protein RRG08_043942 [Elysia crispata]|uniref:Uncharacterized protein n=1 Tax=Elysia crispata TaxID=231223 RepID=A0AAE1CQJ0_9GAST|nr:hypothetical protein RRG08_043942 [Elysia crispata]